MPKTLLIDCDGVLYPDAEFKAREVVKVVKSIYRNNLNLSGAEQKRISQRTIEEGHLGIFNYVKEICNHTGYDFDLFCKQMADRMDYRGIKPNKELFKLLKQQAQNNQVVILTNNSRYHLDKVFMQLFGRNASEVEKNGIKVCDITYMENNGYFYPKQSPQGLTLVAEKLKTPVRDCVLLDDAPVNIQAARAQGMQGILISENNTLRHCLSRGVHLFKKERRTYE